MSISLALNENGDVFLNSEGGIGRARDFFQVVQHVTTRLRFYKGEWFLNTDAGVDYFGKILIKPSNLALTESLIKNEIINTPEVESLTSFEMSFDSVTRKLKIQFSASTVFGEIGFLDEGEDVIRIYKDGVEINFQNTSTFNYD